MTADLFGDPPSPPRRRSPRAQLFVVREPGAVSTVAELLVELGGPAAAELGDDLRALAGATLAELSAAGLRVAEARRLLAAFELARRYGEREFRVGDPFRGSADVYAHFRERLAAELVEVFVAVLLDNKHRKLREVEVSRGSLTASIVHPRDVFRPVIKHAAAAVVFVHNHPSGDPTPSKEDVEITRRLREIGDLMGVRVLDHIVVGQGRYVSFVDDGYW